MSHLISLLLEPFYLLADVYRDSLIARADSCEVKLLQSFPGVAAGDRAVFDYPAQSSPRSIAVTCSQMPSIGRFFAHGYP